MVVSVGTDLSSAAAELHNLSGMKVAEVQEAVCSKAMALCSVVTRYGAVPLPDGKAATINAFLARLIRQVLLLLTLIFSSPLHAHRSVRIRLSIMPSMQAMQHHKCEALAPCGVEHGSCACRSDSHDVCPQEKALGKSFPWREFFQDSLICFLL